MLENGAKFAKNMLENGARLSVATDHELVKGKTIIFFDEVQEFKDIVTAVKFLVEDGSFKYVMSGSLLGVELRDLRSAPVGYLSILKMFPMNFEEFSIALKIKQSTLDYLRDCYEQKKEVDSFIHEKIIDAFYTYLVVGGMPRAVQTYIDENDFENALVLSNHNVSVEGKIAYLPVYMVMFIDEKATPIPQRERIDLSGI